jgi:hypothetical protein
MLVQIDMFIPWSGSSGPVDKHIKPRDGTISGKVHFVNFSRDRFGAVPIPFFFFLKFSLL